MVHQRMQDALNKQVNAEYYSAYLYLGMAARFAELGLPGAVSWMKVQFQEELVHAGMFFDYVLERGGQVELADIAAHDKDWATPQALFEAVLAHEELVTSLIGDLADLALEIKDHSTFQFLQWFIAEQVEEESTAHDVLDKLNLACDAPGGLYVLDKELATRVFTPPVPKA